MKKSILMLSSLALLGGVPSMVLAQESVDEIHSHDHNHDHGHDHDHDHNHEHDHEKKPHQEGKFEDSEVSDRELSDWAGEWQSVFPYLKDGSLDEVMNHKAESGEMTAEEYKEYYTKGYQTDVDKINITEDSIEFIRGEESVTGKYEYQGYEILTYESGKKGVRYLFSKVDGDEAAPQSVQFSDHEIGPTKVGHYHIYFGDQSHEDLLEEMDNWPTYYPNQMDGQAIKEEMLHH
ncbi:metal-binding protein ZinT [Hutsoniella sourekii]